MLNYKILLELLPSFKTNGIDYKQSYQLNLGALINACKLHLDVNMQYLALLTHKMIYIQNTVYFIRPQLIITVVFRCFDIYILILRFM